MASEIEILPPEPDKPERKHWLFKPGETHRLDPARAKMRMHKFAKSRSFAAIQEVYRIMKHPDSTNPVKLQAAQIILERAFGKPQQDVEITTQGRTLEEMLMEIWQTKQQVVLDGDKLIEPITEPSE